MELMAFNKLVFIIFVGGFALARSSPIADSANGNTNPKKTEAKSTKLPEPQPTANLSTAVEKNTPTISAEVPIEKNDTENVNATKYTMTGTGILSFRDHLNIDTGAVKRTFYVVVALTGVVLIYFTVKGIRMKTKRKTRRYGLLSEQELEPLDGDDEEEDMTLFEARRQKKKGRN